MAEKDLKSTSVKDEMTLPISQRSVRNRLIKAALTESLADPNTSQPNDHHYTLYGKWSGGGFAMILSGNVMVDRQHRESPRNVVLCKDSNLKDFEKWALAIHGNNENDNDKPLAIMQLSHPGRQCPLASTRFEINPVSASSAQKARLVLPGLLGEIFSSLLIRPARALTLDEIPDIVQQYVTAAQLAEQAGWDGVQIHAAHGYLLAQFLSPSANQRTDDYGGSPKGRQRILMQIIAAVRKATSPSFVVGIKVNTKDRSTEGADREKVCIDLIQDLCDLQQLDFIELSGGGMEDPIFVNSKKIKNGGIFGSFAQRLQETVQRTEKSPKIILTGGFRTKAGMEAALQAGICDMIGLGRPIIANPMFAKDVLEKDNADASLELLEVPIFKELLEAALNSLWYQRQLFRISVGHSHDPKLSYLYTLAVTFFYAYIWDFGFRGHAAYSGASNSNQKNKKE
jgi:2,4-dienoyl-CoA reductase-like NADH-dependent reductase (Old Yellow Enzyme family)